MDAPDIDAAKKAIEQAFTADFFKSPVDTVVRTLTALKDIGYFDLTLLYRQFYDPNAALLKPVTIGYYVLIGALILLVKRASWPSHPTLREYLFPKATFTSRSFVLDIEWFVLALLKITSGITALLGLIVLMRVVTNFLDGGHFADWSIVAWTRGHLSRLPLVVRDVLLFLNIIVVLDFSLYWYHRLMHSVPALWHFHKVHHYPRQITFLANWRVHPVEALGGDLTDKLALAVVMAVWTPLYSPQDVRGYDQFFQTQMPVLAAVLAVQYFFHAFNHTTIYLPFGGRLDKIFYSPALHMVHHSRDIRDKNFGNIFGLWDWMFGTIYIPKNIVEHYEISQRLGVSNMADEEYKTVFHAIVIPFVDCFPKMDRLLGGRRKAEAKLPQSI